MRRYARVAKWGDTPLPPSKVFFCSKVFHSQGLDAKYPPRLDEKSRPKALHSKGLDAKYPHSKGLRSCADGERLRVAWDELGASSIVAGGWG